MPEFTVRPFPKDGESIHGYLLRVASANGRRDVAELLKITGYRNNFNYQSQIGLDRLLTETSTWYCRWPLEKIMSHFKENSWTPWVFQDKRFIENIIIMRPRFCIECFKVEATRYFRFEWSLLHNSFCATHGCSLLDVCPLCRSPFKWHSKIFNYCASCSTSWNELSIPKNSNEDYFQSEFNRVSEELKKQWYEQFTELVMKAARPYDVMNQKISHLPKELVNINTLLAQAKLLSSERKQSAPLIEWGPKGFVQFRRLKYEASMRYHQNCSEVARVLNISSADISYLINEGLLKPLNPLKVIHVMLFDERMVQDLLNHIEIVDKQAETDVVINEGHRLLTCFYLTFGEFLAQALKHPSIRRFSDGFDSLVIDKVLAESILQESMEIKLLNKDCSLYKVDRFLATAAKGMKVRDLLNRGLVEYNETGNAITGTSLLKYIENNVDQLGSRNKFKSIYL